MQKVTCAVIGVGMYGAQIAKTLAKKGAEVYAIDNNPMKIEALKDDVAFSVALDSTDIKALQSQNIDKVDTAIVAIGENFEAVILTCVQLMELKVRRIIARASGPQQRKILESIGVQEILTPEIEVADAIAESLIHPSIISFLQLPDNYEVAELKTPKKIVGKSIGDAGLRDKYKLTLITIKRCFEKEIEGEFVKEEHTLGVPSNETELRESDTIFVFGTSKDVERFIEINK